MFNKIFNQKRKRQEPGRHNTSKITMDPASTAILSRHFSPLSSRAKSPSDLLDIVGYPFTTSKFTQSSPELILYSTPLQINNNEEVTVDNNRQRLTIRNNTTPPSPIESLSPDTNHDLLLLETSREDKTLVEEEKLDETKQEVYRLHQKLLEFEQERESWKQKLQGYIQREDQMRKIIQENQAQINQLKSMYNTPSRHNSYRTISTHSSSWPTDEDEDDDDMEDDHNLEIKDNTDNRDMYLYHYYTKDPIYYQQQHQYNNGNLKRRYSSYYTNTNNNNNAYYQHQHHHHRHHHRQPYYYYDS